MSQINLQHGIATVENRVVVDFGKLFAETSEQKFSLGGFSVRRFAVIQDEI